MGFLRLTLVQLGSRWMFGQNQNRDGLKSILTELRGETQTFQVHDVWCVMRKAKSSLRVLSGCKMGRIMKQTCNQLCLW